MVQKGVEMDCRSFVFSFKACEQFPGVLEGKLKERIMAVQHKIPDYVHVRISGLIADISSLAYLLQIQSTYIVKIHHTTLR
uniref:Uncharacterized protein n=1 Tax=Salix viminalis TaxID=40686 RepID=A0A6N2M9F0_SALVM